MMTISSVFCFMLAQLFLALCGAEHFEYNYRCADPLTCGGAASSASDDLEGSARRLQQAATVRPMRPHELALSGDTLSGLPPGEVGHSRGAHTRARAALRSRIGWSTRCTCHRRLPCSARVCCCR